jgi:hypothetical protein
MVAILATAEDDFLIKSIVRCFRLCAPPRPFNVIRPRLLRPLQAFLPTVKLRSGFVLVKSVKYTSERERVPGL